VHVFSLKMYQESFSSPADRHTCFEKNCNWNRALFVTCTTTPLHH